MRRLRSLAKSFLSVLLVSGLLGLVRGPLGVYCAQEPPAFWGPGDPVFERLLNFQKAEALYDPIQRRITRQPLPLRFVARESKESIQVLGEHTGYLFSRRNAALDRVRLRERRVSREVILGGLLLVDADGNVYRQANSQDGSLHLKQSPRDRYVLSGNFTPRTDDGRPAPMRFSVEYTLYRTSGLVVVKTKPRDAPTRMKVRRLALENTLGELDWPYLYIQGVHYRDGVYPFYAEVRPTAADLAQQEQKFGEWAKVYPYGEVRFILEVSPQGKPTVIGCDKYPYSLWTDGRVGFQVISVTWEPEMIDDVLEGEDKRLHHHTVWIDERGRRRSDLVFVLKNGGHEVELPLGYEVSEALSLLPYKRFQPSYLIQASSAYFPNSTYIGLPEMQNWYPTIEWNSQVDEALRTLGRDGVTYINATPLYIHGQSYPINPQAYHQFIETCHRYGTKVLHYGGMHLTPVYAVCGVSRFGRAADQIPVGYMVHGCRLLHQAVEQLAPRT